MSVTPTEDMNLMKREAQIRACLLVLEVGYSFQCYTNERERERERESRSSGAQKQRENGQRFDS
ncbi:hypothetical protein JZ751_028697 [Albula glossodonta]|uniref:Uncharacterized protein n=1 Tax=Albula glossodonta TaxID=121402 RepID=A0A8T2NCE3_9TELE|nr:hypothetical protein JZ751_028697 [Albula glossodonta]